MQMSGAGYDDSEEAPDIVESFDEWFKTCEGKDIIWSNKTSRCDKLHVSRPGGKTLSLSGKHLCYSPVLDQAMRCFPGEEDKVKTITLPKIDDLTIARICEYLRLEHEHENSPVDSYKHTPEMAAWKTRFLKYHVTAKTLKSIQAAAAQLKIQSLTDLLQ